MIQGDLYRRLDSARLVKQEDPDPISGRYGPGVDFDSCPTISIIKNLIKRFVGQARQDCHLFAKPC